MPRLVLINGAPGSGKSTLARRYAAEHPLTLALDIDVVASRPGTHTIVTVDGQVDHAYADLLRCILN